jgi:hypothetical protein
MLGDNRIFNRHRSAHFASGLNSFAVIYVLVALLIPNRLSAITLEAFAYLPLEGLLLGLALLVPGRIGLLLRLCAAGLLATGIIFKMADIAAYQVFDRPFNPVLDSRFPTDGMNLLQGTIGRIGAIVVAGLLIALLLSIFWLTNTLLRLVQTLLQSAAQISGTGLVAGLLAWSACAFAGWPQAGKPFYDLMTQHVASIRSGMADLESFNNVVDSDPYAAVPDSALFEKLKGQGCAGGVHRIVWPDRARQSRLRSTYPSIATTKQRRADRKRLVGPQCLPDSPTYGGISWLAHGTLMSGYGSIARPATTVW